MRTNALSTPRRARSTATVPDARFRQHALQMAAVAALFGGPLDALAQVCPTPATATGSACTVPSGTPVTVNTANPVGLQAGAAGTVTANGVAVTLVNAGTTGASADAGGRITFDGSTLRTTSTGAQAAGQTGLRATGTGSEVRATGATLMLGPTTNTASAGVTGAGAFGGGAITLTNTQVTVDGKTNGTGYRGLLASGTGSSLSVSGGSVSVSSRGAFGAAAEDGGRVTLTNGAQVTTSGAQTTGTSPIGSHVLIATGAGSQVTATGITASTSATLANAARAENGGLVTLTGSTLVSTGAGTVVNPTGGVRAVTGGTVRLEGVGSTITASGGNFGHGASVEDAGSKVFLTDTAVSVSGARSIGVTALNGGEATVVRGSVLSSASNAISAEGAGSRVGLTDVGVTSTAATGYGVRSVTGAVVTLERGTVNTQGVNATAVTAAGAGASVTVSNTAVTTSGDGNAMGAIADLDGRIELTGGSVNTSGNDDGQGRRPIGLAARNPGGVLVANGTRVTTTGQSAMGAVADDGGSLSLSNNTIVTEGASSIGLFSVVEQDGTRFIASIDANNISIDTRGALAHGVLAQQSYNAPSTITLDRATVSTRGDGAVGLRAVWVTRSTAPDPGPGATVTATRSVVSTEGAGAHGVLARNPSASVVLDQSSVSTRGPASHGAVVEAGARVTGTATTLNATGARSAALYIVGSPAQVSVAEFSGGPLTNVSGPTIGLTGAANVTLTSASVSGSGHWLHVGPASDFPPLTAPEPPLTGVPDPTDETPVPGPDPLRLDPARRHRSLTEVPLATAGGSNVVATGSILTGSATTAAGSVSDVSLNGNSLWNLTGNSNLTTLANNASQILFTAPASSAGPFKTLTVNQYTGNGNAVIGLNTVLASDGAPSDKLVIDGGTASGQTGLRITNAGGAGAHTVSNGIMVVEAVNGGTTGTAAFALNGRVVAGPYEYQLHRGSVDGSNGEAWYLRSEQPAPPPPPPPPPPPAPPPPAPAPPPPPDPMYRPEVGAYLANQRLSGGLFLHSLHDRLGEPQWTESQGFDRQDDEPRAAWVRLVGKRIDSTSRDGEFDVDSKSLMLQLGGDVADWSVASETDRAHVGLMAGYGKAWTDGSARGNPNRAEATTQGFHIGAYGTWYQNNESRLGWYTDAWGLLGWFDNRVDGDSLGTVKYDSRVVTLSAEAGYAGRPKEDSDWILEPQAQLVYVHSRADGFDEPNGTRIDGAEGSGWVGRLGLRTHRTWVHDSGRRTQPYLTLNWWHDRIDNVIAFNEIAMKDLYPKDRYEVKLGVNVLHDRGWTGWGNVGWQWGQQSYSALSARLGARYTW